MYCVHAPWALEVGGPGSSGCRWRSPGRRPAVTRVASVAPAARGGVYAALRAQRNFKLDGAKTGHDARAARRRADAAREPAARAARAPELARRTAGPADPELTPRTPARRALVNLRYCGLLVCSHAGLTHGPLARPVDKSHTIVAEFLHRRPQCQPEPQGAWLPSSGQPVGWIWPVLCWRFHRSTVYESGYGMPSDGKKLQWN